MPKRLRTLLTSFYSIAAAVFLAGCAGHQPATDSRPTTLYDARLVETASGQPLSEQELATQLEDADVVVIGEHHGHPAAHLLQARLQAALYGQQPAQVLALESFDLDHQAVVDKYLAGDLGEEELIEDADAWNNYKASYRPLIEFARRHRLPVTAANAPDGVVRCIGRQGPGYLGSLPPATRTLLPEQPFRDVPGYREKFLDTLGGSGHSSPSEDARERLENAYQAQLLRDNTMADRILRARQRYPDHQVLMITGTFHSEQRLGLVAILEQRDPGLNVVVISPVTEEADRTRPKADEHREKGDFLYFVLPLPERYQDEGRRSAAMKQQFSQASNLDCQ